MAHFALTAKKFTFGEKVKQFEKGTKLVLIDNLYFVES
jgi:hypothetical protein